MATADTENIYAVSADELPTVRESKSEANILLFGVTGTGKSTLINSLCGAVPQASLSDPNSVELPAKVGHKLKHETLEAGSYEARATDVQLSDDDCTSKRFAVRVWDTPGFLDGTGKERSYVMQANVRCEDGIDLLLYCINMSKRRCIVDEMVPGMKVVTEILGQEVWKHAVIVLTFANNVKPKRRSESDAEKCQDFLDRVGHWRIKVRQALVRAGVREGTSQSVPIEPAGHFLTPHLPDRPHWLGYLWLLVMNHARDSAKVAILLNTQDYICNSQYLALSSEEEEEIHSLISTPTLLDDTYVFVPTTVTGEEQQCSPAVSTHSATVIVIDEKAHNGVLGTLLGPIKKWIQALLRRPPKRSVTVQ